MNEVVVEADEPQVVESFKENIVFENVDFKYQEDGNSILSDINVTVPTGTVLALVGETGSGKSTMANLLARFYDPIAGKVLLDGIDLKELEIDIVRFDQHYGKKITDKGYQSLLRGLNLSAHFLGVKTWIRMIEDEEAKLMAESIGVDYIQGKAIGNIVPIEEIYNEIR